MAVNTVGKVGVEQNGSGCYREQGFRVEWSRLMLGRGLKVERVE